MNTKWEDCHHICFGELFSNPKVKKYIECSLTCFAAFKIDYKSEFADNILGAIEFSSKI